MPHSCAQRHSSQVAGGVARMIPDVWPFALVALAAYRTWKLLAEDIILEPARKGPFSEGGKAWPLISCPWCLGAWISVAWWGAWWEWPHDTLVVSVPFALSAVVGTLAMAVMALARD